MLVSLPAGRPTLVPVPSTREPLWARVPSPPRALLLRMNCRSEPWPALLVFTTTSKLKPKSTLLMAVGVGATVTLAMDSGVVVPVVRSPRLWVPVRVPASVLVGSWPPTRAVLPLAKVCTGTRVLT